MKAAIVWIKKSFLVAFVVLVGGALSACASRQSKPNIEHMLANATTAADHLNIAEYYNEEAAEDEAKYQEHERDAARYEHAIRFREISVQHCKQLAQDYKQAAQDASVLAAEHRKVADEISAGNQAPAESSGATLPAK